MCPRWDQLGQRRVDIPGVGTSRCDIGAIEVQPRDTTPPAILVTATAETLWPPNGQLVPITITGTITDVGSGVDPDTAVFAVMDAYGSPQPRDHITLGKDGSYTCTLHLQASRKGNDTNGRQYTIRPYRREAATRPHFGELFSLWLLLDSRGVDVLRLSNLILVILSSLKPLFFNDLKKALHFSDNVRA